MQEALTDILHEFDHMRHQLEHSRAHVAYLEEAADNNSFLPVKSRHGLMRELSRRQLVSERVETTSSFVYIRLRAIDIIGEELGHLAAQEALKHVAAILHQGLRASDAIGCLGGNAFGIILALAGSETALAKTHDLAVGDSPEEIFGAANRDLLVRRKSGDAGASGGKGGG
ncbi:MAG TPA: diguanylate cyclase [Rhodospirillales bacterium]|nr:diguanylate cyclase [Rhodospirillales bacterium]